jgi:hypothetical protein
MRRLAIVGAVVALLAMALPGSALAAKPGAGTCAGGTPGNPEVIPANTYSGFTVTGFCVFGPGTTTINGNLTVAPGAGLDDHGAEQWMGAELHVTGNVKVGKGAALGLGWNGGGPLPGGEGKLGPDTVGGNIIANQPLALQIGQVTIDGNLISNGGGVTSLAGAERNFPVEDNVIHGNLIVQGWTGGWIGLIRNTVDGNVIFANNVSMWNRDTGTGMDPDSSEVMGSMGPFPQTIGGNLICHDNVPAAQVNPNPPDSGAANFVGGKAIGECAGLTQ